MDVTIVLTQTQARTLVTLLERETMQIEALIAMSKDLKAIVGQIGNTVNAQQHIPNPPRG